MDRGAARSRKKETEKARPVDNSIDSKPRPIKRDRKDLPARAGPSTSSHRQPEPDTAAAASRFRPKIIDNTDPARFRPKAIRDSAALIWSQGPFSLPPSKESLANVTRVDLAGSECADVSWLQGTNVTWLNLKGCPIEKGWDAVGSLPDLAVLNLSDTRLQRLPSALSELRKLKALVAMANPWTAIDSEIVKEWTQLNSMIASHSPNLEAMPAALGELRQLSKISFSHCPRLREHGLPDLSDLPLLRDVKLNNLPLLDSLPVHISTWGKGELPLSERTSAARHGDGLEVLDLGNCSLPFSTVEALFLGRDWPHLRSLSLHSNPLALSHPDYSATLRDSNRLPNLQIIDAKRVVERKRKGEVQETRLEKRRREKMEKRRMTGANAKIVTDKSRVWGGEKLADDSGALEPHSSTSIPSATAETSGELDDREGTSTDRKKRKRSGKKIEKDASLVASTPDPAQAAALPADDGGLRKKRKRVKGGNDALKPDTPAVRPAAPASKPKRPDAGESSTVAKAPHAQAAVVTKAKPSRKAEGGKVEVVAKSAGGVNLKEAFARPKDQEQGGGLGLGGW